MKAVSICTDAKTHQQLEQRLSERGDITLCRGLATYPDTVTLGRVLRGWAPDIIFLDIRHVAVEDINAYLAHEFPEIRRIAIHPAQLADVFRRVLHMGMHELVSPPFKEKPFSDALDRVATHIRLHPVKTQASGRVFAYMPAKSGVGASTLATHATWAAAEDPEARVLLADFDRYSGIVSFLCGVEHEYSMRDALAQAEDLDEDLWRSLVKSTGNVDLLLSASGKIDETGEERHISPLLQFAQRNYTVVHADLPDSLDPHTLAVLHEADQIFLVTTPELPALRLAKLKADTLRELQLSGRAALLVNRMNPRHELSMKDIEAAVGLDAFATFPCHYKSVSGAIRDAKPAPALSKFVREFVDKSLGWKSKAPGRRFTERFTVPSLSFRFRETA